MIYMNIGYLKKIITAKNMVVSTGFAVMLSGCAVLGPIFVTPGQTVQLISASQYQVTYEYTHDYDSELPFAGQQAEQQCNRFGKHAAFDRVVRRNLDRSWAIFRCE
jgi:hypothetical protein